MYTDQEKAQPFVKDNSTESITVHTQFTPPPNIPLVRIKNSVSDLPHGRIQIRMSRA